MWRWRIGVMMLVVVSLVWTGTPAFAGPGRKVGPPPEPPGQVEESPGRAEGRQVGPVETAPGQARETPNQGKQKGQAKEKPKQGKQKGHAKQLPPAEGVPTE
jgi:hypothetical protein